MKRLFMIYFLFVTLLSAYESNIDSKKMILLYVEMNNCPWCKRMDREVFDNDKIFKELKKLYTIKRVKKGSDQIPSTIKTKYYPTTYILNYDKSKVIEELPGYMKAEDYLDYLQTVYEVENSSGS